MERHTRRSLGLCSECDEKAVDGRVFCEFHREQNRLRNQRHREKRIRAGICLICQQPSVPGKARCQEHLRKQAQSARKVKENRMTIGLCRRCGSPTKGTSYCEDCRAYYRDVDQRRYRAIRQEIVSLLGGACAVCGSPETELLEIDHVNSDGHRERAAFGNGRFMYSKILLQLKNDPNSGRYQLLCFNCHQRKTRRAA